MSSSNSINAGVGGVGSGTGIVAIAQAVGVHSIIGQILIYAAPAVSVIAGTLVGQLSLEAELYIERWQSNRARKILEQQLRCPHTSDDHKAKIRRSLEELDRSVVASELARIRLTDISVDT
jgi:hypothetical protein